MLVYGDLTTQLHVLFDDFDSMLLQDLVIRGYIRGFSSLGDSGYSPSQAKF